MSYSNQDQSYSIKDFVNAKMLSRPDTYKSKLGVGINWLALIAVIKEYLSGSEKPCFLSTPDHFKFGHKRKLLQAEFVTGWTRIL